MDKLYQLINSDCRCEFIPAITVTEFLVFQHIIYHPSIKKLLPNPYNLETIVHYKIILMNLFMTS